MMRLFRKLCRLLLQGGALVALVQGGAAHAQPPACPTKVVTCCDVTAALPGQTEGALQLGLQVWPEDAQNVVPRVHELRPVALRYGGGPSWRRMPHLDHKADYDTVRRYIADAFARDADRYGREVGALKAMFAGLGAEAHLVIWEPPVTDAEASGNTARDKRTLPEAAVPVTAMFYVALLEELRRRGYPVDVVELSNEPDGDWNIAIPPTRYLRLVGETRRLAKQHNVALPRIAGPGVSRISALRSYVADPALGKGLVGVVDQVSVHAWDDRTNRDTIAEARQARRQLDALGYRKAILVSEFALTFLAPADRGRGIGADRRAPDAVSNQPGYAAKTMALALDLAATGYGPLLYWELVDPRWGKASYGLYSERGERRPALEGWRLLSQRARQAGEVHVVTLVPDTIFGLVYGGKLSAIAMVNASAAPLGVTMNDTMKARIATPAGQHRALAECTGGGPGTRSLQPSGFVIFELN
ncbi:hypothetical protein FHP25_36930 [Vineibacter terrae]|uniref:Asl1-like glycosyl hydrolase catalytic domain-containing protein n=1 Tax=Vineibacter terrae TaxID=2586908 RepID=A0A5C8P984_9HYPH|nr:hypothetical protein [Vineibacter terrae]TXL69898.1 hypothetical protein FHP25_36930 [Vineibacter terrae]